MPITKDEKQNEKLLAELETMKHCEHPNVINCYGAFIHVSQDLTLSLSFIRKARFVLLLNI